MSALELQAWKKQYRFAAAFHRKLRRWPGLSEEFPSGNKLGLWCHKQHSLFAEGRLSADCLRHLLMSGFPLRSRISYWPPRMEESLRMKDRYFELFLFQFGNLKRFRELYPDRWPSDGERFPENNPMGTWVTRLRRDFGHGKIPPYQRRLLDSIGFVWGGIRDTIWNRQYERVRILIKKYRENWRFYADRTLLNWVGTNRQARDAGRLTLARMRWIRALGSHFEPQERWEDSFAALCAFLHNHHRWPGSAERNEQGFHLGRWIVKQRLRLHENTLQQDQIDALIGIGFPFEAQVWKDQWETQFETLKAFRQRYPERWPRYEEAFPKGNALGIWCSVQRTKAAHGELKPERKRRLSAMGFSLSMQHGDWEARYAEFATWQRRHRGRLPRSAGGDATEARQRNWLIKQKTALRKDKVRPEQVRQLGMVGITAE